MPLRPDFLSSPGFDRLSEADRRHVEDTARALRAADRAGHADKPLHGKNIGLLCEADDNADAAMFERAARTLGARVVRIRPSVAGLADDATLQQTAQMLGKLYDAIECQGLPPATVERIRRHAGVPVFDHLASANPSAVALAKVLDGFDGGSDSDNLRYVLQAMLIGTIS